jgi:hypothetical protein
MRVLWRYFEITINTRLEFYEGLFSIITRISIFFVVFNKSSKIQYKNVIYLKSYGFIQLRQKNNNEFV